MGRQSLGIGAIGFIVDSGGGGASPATNSDTKFLLDESAFSDSAAAGGFLTRVGWGFELMENEKLILILELEECGDVDLRCTPLYYSVTSRRNLYEN